MNRCDICNFFLDETAFADYVEDGYNICVSCQEELDEANRIADGFHISDFEEEWMHDGFGIAEENDEDED
jgi:hypothetical protein